MTLDMILTMPGKTRRLGAALTALILLSSAGPTAALNVTVNTEIAAGQAAFGPARLALDWARFFPPGSTWLTGALGPSVVGDTDPATGDVIDGRVDLRNWLDGPGFDAPGGSAAPDLAIGGAENFTLHFGGPPSSAKHRAGQQAQARWRPPGGFPAEALRA